MDGLYTTIIPHFFPIEMSPCFFLLFFLYYFQLNKTKGSIRLEGVLSFIHPFLIVVVAGSCSE